MATKTKKSDVCEATTVSKGVENHTHHTCIGKHDPLDGSHFCGVCGRWWWVKDA